MREISHEMSGMWTSKLVARLFGLLTNDGVELLASHVGALIELRLCRVPYGFQRIAQLELHRVIA